MITLTQQAAKHVRLSIEQGDAAGLFLRIAATRDADGAIAYQMGFDEVHDDDFSFRSEGIDLVVAKVEQDLLNGTTIDYVEIEPGSFRFIFLNPNDPDYRPPTEA